MRVVGRWCGDPAGGRGWGPGASIPQHCDWSVCPFISEQEVCAPPQGASKAEVTFQAVAVKQGRSAQAGGRNHWRGDLGKGPLRAWPAGLLRSGLGRWSRPWSRSPLGLWKYFFSLWGNARSHPCHWRLGGIKCIHVAWPSPPSVSVCLAGSFHLATEACSVRHCLPPLPARSLPWPSVGSTQA